MFHCIFFFRFFSLSSLRLCVMNLNTCRFSMEIELIQSIAMRTEKSKTEAQNHSTFKYDVIVVACELRRLQIYF